MDVRRLKQGRDKYRTEAPVETFIPIDEDQLPIDSHEYARKGRNPREFRPFFLRTGVITQASGSAYIEAEHTKVVCAAYGPRPATGSYAYRDKGKLTCSFKYATFSSPGNRHNYRPSRTEEELGELLVQALEVSLRLEAFPKSVVEVFVLVLQDDGAAFSTAVNCATLALADAGVEMFDLVSSCSVARAGKTSLLDPSLHEESQQFASVTIALMPSVNEISQFIQYGELGQDEITEAVELCLDGCSQLHSILTKSLMAAVTSREGIASDTSER